MSGPMTCNSHLTGMKICLSYTPDHDATATLVSLSKDQ